MGGLLPELPLMPIPREKLKFYPGGSIRSVAWRVGYRAPILERAGNRCEGTPQRPHCRAENSNLRIRQLRDELERIEGYTFGRRV